MTQGAASGCGHGVGRLWQDLAVALADRPLVPEEWVLRIDAVLGRLPRCRQEAAWTGTRWRVGGATVAHVFGGEDQVFRITFRGEPDEVAAFEHMGDPYFRSGWGGNVIGMVLDEEAGIDWEELAELLTDSYCLQAPTHLAQQVERPAVDGT
jgi:hypothetical protein